MALATVARLVRFAEYRAPPAVEEPVASDPYGGLSETEYQWLFGDPEVARSQLVDATPDVMRRLTPEEKKRRKIKRLLARGGLSHGRGARILEGDEEAPA